MPSFPLCQLESSLLDPKPKQGWLTRGPSVWWRLNFCLCILVRLAPALLNLSFSAASSEMGRCPYGESLMWRAHLPGIFLLDLGPIGVVSFPVLSSRWFYILFSLPVFLSRGLGLSYIVWWYKSEHPFPVYLLGRFWKPSHNTLLTSHHSKFSHVPAASWKI